MGAGAQAPWRLNRDSLKKDGSLSTDKHWLFQPGDNLTWASPAYDDRAWKTVPSFLPLPQARDSFGFRERGWFRLHFTVDSSLLNVPLAYTLSQEGASVVYLDGVPLDTFGKIGDARNYSPYTPGGACWFFTLRSTAPHVLAVRYENMDVLQNWQQYNTGEAGFRLTMGLAETLAASQGNRLGAKAGAVMLFFGLFLALGLLHLFLFLYNRQQRSHLFFALFSLCVALFLPFMYFFSLADDPVLVHQAKTWNKLWAFGAVFFLSAFLNSAFPVRRKWLFWGISLVCLWGLVTMFKPHLNSMLPLIVALILIALEAVVITLNAMWKRRPGARILGAGFLFLALFILVTFGLVLLKGDHQISIGDSSSDKEEWLLLLLAVMLILSIPLSISAYLAWSVARTNKDLKLRLDEVATLSEQTWRQEEEKQKLLQSRQEELEREVALRTEDLRYQKQRSDDLLLNILPAEVAEELKEKGTAAARQFAEVSVLFTDFAGFTQISERLSPQALVQELHECFTTFDAIMEKHGLEKIKTIGDAYLAVCGLPVADPHHAGNAVKAALEILDFIAARRRDTLRVSADFAIRIGIHSGPVVAGIVGVKKFAYDIWGDTVNTAARMEQSGEPGKVNISQSTYELVRDDFRCTPRGKIAAKGKGEVEMYFVEGV